MGEWEVLLEQALTIVELDAFFPMEIAKTMEDKTQKMKCTLMAISLFAQVYVYIYFLFFYAYMLYII